MVARDAGGVGLLALREGVAQALEFAPLPVMPTGTASILLKATANTGLPVRFELLSGSATLSKAMLSPTGSGLIRVRAIQDGNAQFLPASVERAIAVAAKQHGYSFDLALVDDVALVVERKAGLGIVDVSNPAEPVRIGGAPGCSGYGQRDIRTLLPGRGTLIDLEITREVAASPLPQVLSGEAALRPPPGILTPRNPIVAETTCHFT